MAAAAPSSNRFSTIFALCPVGLALTAEDGLVVEANPALAATLGADRDEIVGRRLLDFTHPDDRGTSSSVGQAVLSGDRSEVTLEKRYITISGETVPVRVTMIALEEPDGGAHKLVQVEDLSQQRATEDDLRREALEDPLTGVANRRARQRELTPLLGDGEPSAPDVEPGT